jgi:hypothetical protein
MGRKLRVDMDDVVVAMNVSRDDVVRFFLDLTTGTVEVATVDDRAMKQKADVDEAVRWFDSLELEPIYELRPVEVT